MRGVTENFVVDATRQEVSRRMPALACTEAPRPEVYGKFLSVAEEKLYVRGVTYGTFETDSSGNELWRPEWVARDFQAIARNGFNALRTYTAPPKWFLDLAL